MYIEQEVNIYQPAAISKEFKTQDTKIEAINGKIGVLMTETEMQELTDSSATMYSRLAQAELDIDSLDLQFADTQTRFNAIDGKFSSVDTRLAEYSASIDGLSADISSVSRSLNDDYSTTTAMNAAIQASVDGLSSTVSETYATKTSLNATTEQLTSKLAQTTSDITASVAATYATKTQFDALAIGATNLLRNTRTLKDANKSSASYCSVEENADGFSVFKRNAYSSNLTVYVQPAPYLNFYDNAKGKTLTVSVMVRSDSAEDINKDSVAGIRIGFVLANKNESSYSYSIQTKNFNTYQISTEWKKFSYTFEWSGSLSEPAWSGFVISDETLFGIRFFAYGKYSMEYKMFKLEEGEKATAWSPSPLDAEADILAIDTRLTNAELKITDSAITSTVTSSNAWIGLSDKVDSAQTSITNLDTRLDQAESSITQNANEISTRVSTLSNTVDANSSSINGLKTRMDSAESSITQNATQISTRVAKNGVISAINQSSESITINASKLNLTGYITATNLKTAGQTVINGSNITTGTIKDANSNTTFNLSTGELTINKGSINLGNGNFVLNTNGDLTCKTCTVNGVFETPHTWNGSYGQKWVRIKDCAIYGTRFAEFYNHFETSIEMLGSFTLPGSSSTCIGLKFNNIDGHGIWFGKNTSFLFGMDLNRAYFGCDVDMRKNSILNQSDLRLKDNVTKIESKIDSLERLNIYEFDWKDGSGHVEAGFIAQELQKVYPELVVEGEDGYLGINTIGMIPHMWGIMQGMNSRISSLEMKAKEQS